MATIPFRPGNESVVRRAVEEGSGKYSREVLQTIDVLQSLVHEYTIGAPFYGDLATQLALSEKNIAEITHFTRMNESVLPPVITRKLNEFLQVTERFAPRTNAEKKAE